MQTGKNHESFLKKLKKKKESVSSLEFYCRLFNDKD